MSTQKILDNITNSALRIQVFKSLKDLNGLMSKLNVSSDYKTQALIDALTDHPLDLDVDEPVEPQTKIKKFLSKGHKHDQAVHELWNSDRTEYWFWIMSKPFPKIHVKMSKLK